MHAAALITMINAAVSPAGQGASVSGGSAKASVSGQPSSAGVQGSFAELLTNVLGAAAATSLASGPATTPAAPASEPADGGPIAATTTSVLPTELPEGAPQPAIPSLAPGLLAAASRLALAAGLPSETALSEQEAPPLSALTEPSNVSAMPVLQGRKSAAAAAAATLALDPSAQPVFERTGDGTPAVATVSLEGGHAAKKDPAEAPDPRAKESGTPPFFERDITVSVCNVAPTPTPTVMETASDASGSADHRWSEPGVGVVTSAMPKAPGVALENGPGVPFDSASNDKPPLAADAAQAQSAAVGSTALSLAQAAISTVPTPSAAAIAAIAQNAPPEPSALNIPPLPTETLAPAETPAAIADHLGVSRSGPERAMAPLDVTGLAPSAVTPHQGALTAADAPMPAGSPVMTPTQAADGQAAVPAKTETPSPASAPAVVTVPAAPPLAAAAPVAAQLAAAAVTSITGERTAASDKAEPAAPTAQTAAVSANAAQPTGKSPSFSGQGGNGAASEQRAHEAPAAVVAQVELDEPAADRAAAEPLRAEPALQSAALSEARTPQAVRGAPETVANLAAEIAKRVDGRTTRFEMSLDPLDLGAVQVSLEIAADGSLAARVACERPEALAELRARSAELQRALEQAGFDLSKGGLSFEQGGGRERHAPDGQPRHENARARAFQDALLAAEAADSLPAQPLRLRDRSRAGLDVRI